MSSARVKIARDAAVLLGTVAVTALSDAGILCAPLPAVVFLAVETIIYRTTAKANLTGVMVTNCTCNTQSASPLFSAY